MSYFDLLNEDVFSVICNYLDTYDILNLGVICDKYKTYVLSKIKLNIDDGNGSLHRCYICYKKCMDIKTCKNRCHKFCYDCVIKCHFCKNFVAHKYLLENDHFSFICFTYDQTLRDSSKIFVQFKCDCGIKMCKTCWNENGRQTKCIECVNNKK